MKSLFVRGTAAICGLTLVATLLVGCGSTKPANNASTNSKGESTKSNEPVKLTMIIPAAGRVPKDNNPVVIETEKRLNIKLDFQMIDGTDAEFRNKYNVIVASGNVPDITKDSEFNFQSYASQGLYLDLGPLLDKYAPNLKKNLKPESWDLAKYDGKQYSIPYENSASKIVPVIRKDWLDNLGLKVPTNTTEFADVLKKFTLNDPDQNGKNDTFGMTSGGKPYIESFQMIFGAFGIQPDTFFLKDNKVYASSVSNEFKAAVEYSKALWDSKVIDPEIFILKADQANQKLVQGKVGYVSTWWSLVPQTLTSMKYKDVNPKAEWTKISPLVKGPDGKSGMLASGSVQGTVSISAKSKNPEVALKFLDYINTDEGWELEYYGIKGVHYTEFGKPRTPEGDKAFAENWLNPLSQIVSRKDLGDKINQTSTDPKVVQNRIYQGPELLLIQDLFYGVVADDVTQLIPDVQKLQEEWFIKFVTGAEPMSKWDEYVNQWKTKGGKQIIDSKLKLYNKRAGKQYTSGI